MRGGRACGASPRLGSGLASVQQTGMAADLPTPAPRLPAAVLAKRDALPLKPDPVVLTGKHVIVEPLDLEADLAALHAMSNGAPFALGDRTVAGYGSEARIWRYMSAGPFAPALALRAWLEP